MALYGSLVQDEANNSAHARQLASTIREAARTGLDNLRSVLQAMPQAPKSLQQLAAELAVVAERNAGPAAAKLHVDVSGGGEVILSGGLRTALVRIFQETVHNALRHGAASRIDASLGADDDAVHLRVADDGVGFDPAVRNSGTGLAGMQARAREVGGELHVSSCPGEGTTVQVTLPLERVEVPR